MRRSGTLFTRLYAVLALLAVTAAATSHAAIAAVSPPPPSRAADGQSSEPGAMLAKTLIEMGSNRLDAALLEVDKVIQRFPNFRLAHLIKGDLLAARARPLRGLGDAPNAPLDRVEDLRDEARVRLARYQLKRPTDRVPKYLLQLNPQQKHALIVDIRSSTLFVFENNNGTPRYVADYYITSGKNGSAKRKEGDKKTPLGVYHVTASLSRTKLSDFYGAGAFPISYPNEWDRREGRDGNGIWLHGTPSDTYSRPPRASDGCVVLTNNDLEAISTSMQVGITPVIIADGIDWVKSDTLASLRKDLLKNIETWRENWESLNTANYLSHYAPGFSSGGQNLAAWSKQKREVNASKSWIKVKLERVSIFLYPGRDNLAVATFEQDYSSNNLSNRMKKRQYWINERGTWRILYEGAA